MKRILPPLLCTLLGACSAPPTAQQLLHHRYVLQAIDGHPLAKAPRAPTPDLEFGESLWLSASLCGQLSGWATLRLGTLRIAAPQRTPAPCPDPAWQPTQRRLETMLRHGARLTLQGETLELRDAQGSVLRYRLRDWM
ncbi:META domain-containing protein [Edwardsiella anguillarum]|uniref:META domain-containing protein n=2 Tax=Edwardsiella anguillarum TaxID=1821960 RepID=A0ABY8SP56_9GAMM|nr:META domain-containing protein [Edwardsiella anguillarum]AIJ10230.1 putative heat shock protein HslJ [Edwardsiella anguillarum ET080813]KAB0592102.1 META domain-containing protein [Edwardsiella anguillarum]UOU77455.1 META domain-containing protein [Edwardsiella anguillarum]WHP85648.1 META domain-containing protein [Edwardsiella anguillarum]WHP89429.1 META domain-containing protein [Edwardsiella anguillarum]